MFCKVFTQQGLKHRDIVEQDDFFEDVKQQEKRLLHFARFGRVKDLKQLVQIRRFEQVTHEVVFVHWEDLRDGFEDLCQIAGYGSGR